VPYEIKQEILNEVYRVLKPQGKLLITDFGSPLGIGKLLSLLFRNHAFIDDNFGGKVNELVESSKFKLLYRYIQFGLIHHLLLTKES
jgi:ubiquinone/menaquinone biosynthesis C-methylase UbiE